MSGYSSEGVLVNWDEDRDMALLDRYKVWILDRKETLRCATPFDLWMLQYAYDNVGLQYGHEYLSVPECRGFDCKLKDGWVYNGTLFTTPEEREARMARFEERIAPWIEDFGREYGKGVEEVMAMYEKAKAVDVEGCEDWELSDAFEDWVRLYRRAGNLHMVWLNAYCKIYELFEEMCKELVGIDRNDRLFNDLMAGFNHKILQTDREMFHLGVKAKANGLEPLFQATPDDEELLEKLETTPAAKVWLKNLDEFLREYGWRTIENWDASHPTWIEKPSQILPSIRRFMSVPVFALDEAHPKLVEARNEAEGEVLSRVAEEKREAFARLMKAAQWSSVVDEEHPFYAENYGNALARRVTKEIGKRFVVQGIIDDPQDVYFLLPEEIGVRILGRFPAHGLVARRKEEHIRFRRAEPELFIGDITKLGEVIASSPMLRSTQQPHPRVRPELKADLYGTVSTPGVVEGIVNVLLSEEDFDKFVPGSILVTIETSSVWTPLFNIAKAVITDVGGILSHSAILGREYGLPVISGCVEGTKKLKTGMRVRVDGDVGVVYILDSGEA
ncbi:MAG TPA: PEP-utilizing enzyme [Thermoleophilia bacterium]|nr:PEP-utilizing enzyme [Thermoleophilia bacterium]